MTGVGVLAAGGAGLAIAAVRHETHIRPNTFVGDVNLGYLPVPEAGRKIEEWFAATASRPLRFISDDLTSQPAPISAEEIGAELDLAATLARLPKEDFWGEVGRNVSRSTPARTRVAPVFAFKEEKLDQVAGFIEENLRDAQPARARFQKGTVVRVPEKAGLELNRSRFGDAVGQAMLEGAPVALPLQTAAKRVPDEALNRIQDIVGTYGTRFSAGERDRSANIRLAAQIIDGIVLMPGESFSFNRVVGRRTAAGGFKRAGV
ncbi:MAG: VanW family protein, partial [Fimbriimonadaceae bacterium]|nr:VanW family protein [Fimbriimonadaceae bacterium]